MGCVNLKNKVSVLNNKDCAQADESEQQSYMLFVVKEEQSFMEQSHNPSKGQSFIGTPNKILEKDRLTDS